MTHELDGIKYEITVTAGKEGYAAVWTCIQCNAGGTIAKVFPTADEAVEKAKALLLTAHHALAHERIMQVKAAAQRRQG